MALFDKFNKLANDRAELFPTGLSPFETRIEEVYSPTEARIGGRRVLLAGTNNYLGLTFAPECIEAAHKAVEREGTGTTGSRMANGSYGGHYALEAELGDFYRCNSVIVFSTGYLASLGLIGTLAGAQDIILLDADCHASIYDACRLSGAQIIRFRHNDVADLERRLQRLRERTENTLIVVEGLYSMLGDRAPLAEIAAVKRRHGGYLVVDEAHSLGVLGEHGRGLSEEAGVAAEVDFVLGTFSKSLGAVGGFLASNHPESEFLRYASRPYIFTASPSPSVVASTRAALQLLRNRPQLRERLWANATQLYHQLRALGYQLGPEPSPVVATLLGSRQQAVAFWQGLLERNIYVNLVLPPAAPGGYTLVRCSVSAAHTPAQIDTICEAFADLRAMLKRSDTPDSHRG
ncbi:serine palmitoyltransferase [Nitrococcus mobilis]|uniref:8-amino-7-oxononanoate synthase n=1 Tax=Nitrococcus mobilis Nb-231 TaxID=314278 RepID=A4BMX5_9GAMM|nr:aminotransferase class I/II-fold pyridoxal phosphate-dependent enzyme [Nitrococcus mobilis]EAR22574.1 8-amino-7-oxononanoate synthase [Nitrococcus mobilis Nb-231]